MLERHVRRLPVVDGSKLVGMVTLDDLIADKAVDPDTLAAIVRAQLAEPARLKQAGKRRPGAADHRVEAFGWRRDLPRRERRAEPRRDFASHLRRDVARAFRRITGG
jgi:CBS domain-containing protein